MSDMWFSILAIAVMDGGPIAVACWAIKKWPPKPGQSTDMGGGAGGGGCGGCS